VEPLQSTIKHAQKISVPKRYGIRGNPNHTIIPESDLYRLIIRSKLPAAEQFENWVMEIVLPQIRKTGAPTADIRSEEIISLGESWSAS
jgi:anti-repressor protein